MVHANENERKAGIIVLRSDKIAFKANFIMKDKGHYGMKKRSI